MCHERRLVSQCQAAQKADQYILTAEAQQRVKAGRLGLVARTARFIYDDNPMGRARMLSECVHPTTPDTPV